MTCPRYRVIRVQQSFEHWDRASLYTNLPVFCRVKAWVFRRPAGPRVPPLLPPSHQGSPLSVPSRPPGCSACRAPLSLGLPLGMLPSRWPVGSIAAEASAQCLFSKRTTRTPLPKAKSVILFSDVAQAPGTECLEQGEQTSIYSGNQSGWVIPVHSISLIDHKV